MNRRQRRASESSSRITTKRVESVVRDAKRLVAALNAGDLTRKAAQRAITARALQYGPVVAAILEPACKIQGRKQDEREPDAIAPDARDPD